MTPGLSASSIVCAWETAQGWGPLDRAVMLLWEAGVAEDPAALPMVERDRRLLAVRGATFGDTLACVTECPDCATALELDLSASELGAALPSADPETIEGDDRVIELRALDSRDVAAAAAVPDSDAPGLLRARACGAELLPPTLVAEIDARIESREAESEISVALHCAECGNEWHEVFDVAAHFWTEVAQTARRVMGETAEIAAAFGWAESEILAMSEPRRCVYLQIARGG